MRGPALQVRDAEFADAAAIGELVERVYLGEGWSAETARPRLADGGWVMLQGNALVALANGMVVGTVLLVLPGDPGRQIGLDDEVEVRLLAVSPELRGMGAAEALMRDLLARAKEQHFAGVVLSTQEAMAAAQRLYNRLEFERQPARDWVRASGARMLVYRLALT